MTETIWAIVPAAGTGERLGATTPKQYLKVRGKTLLERAISPLLAHPRIKKIVIVLSADDTFFSRLPIATHPKILTTTGGATRCESVRNGLAVLPDPNDNDWVMVHDAVRPCFTTELLHALIEGVADHPVGGLLALPPSDTLKLADVAGNVIKTVDRTDFWRAQTPQIFRINILSQAFDNQEKFTDESQAVEALGHQPKLIPSSPTNIKVTQPADLNLVDKLLIQHFEIF